MPPIYILFALGAAFFFSINAIFSKISSKYAINEKNTLIFYLLIISLIFTPFLLFFSPLQNPLNGIIPLLLFSITFFIGNFFIITVLFRYDISVLHPFFHFQTIFSVLFAYLFLGEIFPSITYLWIITIIVGGIIVSLDEKINLKAILSHNFLLFVLGICFFALSDIFATKTLGYINVYSFKFWSTIVLAFIALLFYLPQKEKKLIKRLQFSTLALTSFFSFLATLFLFKAFSYNVTITQPIAMFGSLITLIISTFLSRFKPEFLESHSLKIYILRGTGIILMIFSAIMLSKV